MLKERYRCSVRLHHYQMRELYNLENERIHMWKNKTLGLTEFTGIVFL